MKRCFRIKGRVQGVGFRYWLVHNVKKIGNISGYVCNHTDGDVIVYASGKDEELNKLYILLHKGPLFAKVNEVIYDENCSIYFPDIQNGVFKRL